MNSRIHHNQFIPLLADVGVSISDLKRNPAAVCEMARVKQVAILNRNRPVAYVVSPEVWDHILDVFDDNKLAREIESRFNDDEEAIEVSLEDLV